MSTIKDELYFNYGGVSSRLYGLIHVNLSNDMLEESMVSNRDIMEEEVLGNDTPSFTRVRSSPKTFDMVIAFEREFTEMEIENIVLWLFGDGYKPLFFEGSPERIFYCTPVGDSKIVHNGLKQGYITISMRCNSPYAFSPEETTMEYVVSGTKTINIVNDGHYTIYPEISIVKIGSGEVEFINDESDIFQIIDLENQENIYVNCKKEIIETDAIGIYRYENVVGNYSSMRLKRGLNSITVNGNCKIKFKYTSKYKF